MPSPTELLRSKSYVVLVVLGAIIGVPVAAVAYFFLKLVGEAQQYLYETLPGELGFDSQPSWWPIPLRDAIVDAGDIALADEWIHAKDLIAVGVAASE